MKTLQPITINCEVLPDGTVLPHPGYAGSVMQDGPYHGACRFDYLPARGTEPAYIVARAAPEAEAAAAAALAFTPWIPTLSMSFGLFDLGGGLGEGTARYLLESEPPFGDPAFGNLTPVYGAGNEFWLTIDFGGGLVFDGGILAGAEAVLVEPCSAAPVTFTAVLYTSSAKSVVLSTHTRDFTP